MSDPSSGPGGRRDRRQVFIPAPDATKKSAPRAPAPRPPRAPRANPSASPARANKTSTAPPRAAPSTKKTGTKKKGRTWLRIAALIGLIFVMLMAGGLLWANWKFSQIERVEVSSALGGGSGTNYLFVGSDTREGIDADNPNAGAFLDEPVAGERADTLLILRISGDGATMLSIPRDLLVTIADTGQQTRINAAFAGGPERLVKTIRDNLDIPIHRYVEVDFVTFGGLVDAVGGITIDFPNPASDPKTGLNIETAGPQTLDGDEALAFVRSRNFTEVIDGRPRVDPTGDLGRVQRQQQFLSAVLDKVGSTRNPFKLMSMGNNIVGGLRIDDEMSLFDALGLLWRMGGLDPQPQTLPTVNVRTSSGAAVLDLVRSEADPILAEFR